jgi:FtsP/CotA-like multicopper oxidase with cupredoxin domain
VIESDALEPDQSVVPPALRALPPVPANLSNLTTRTFELQRSNKHWMINGRDFDPTAPLANPTQGTGEVWAIINGGGGWVHPVHIHMEEHHVLWRNGVPSPDTQHPDDNSKEDVVALEPGEQVILYRKFRSFKGPYVCHCHNLAHEDHAMMFAWNIV